MSTEELLQAARTGDLAALKQIASADPAAIRSTAASGETPLMTALYHKQDAAAEWLAASGAPIALERTCANGDCLASRSLSTPLSSR